MLAITTPETTTRPAVWVGCLACYNQGKLAGEWVDAEDATEVSLSEIHPQGAMTTACEEMWCFDSEGFPKGTGEMSPATAASWGELYDEVGSEWEAFCAWVENISPTVDSCGVPSKIDFEEQYLGEYTSFPEYLEEEIAEFISGWPEDAQRYFNHQAYERDAKFDYTVVESGSGVYVFRNC